MQSLQIDLTSSFVIICISVVLVMVLRFLDALAARSAVSKTKKILEEHRKSLEL
ncbi:MAG: hypothetical protein JXA30_22530 [Deltaproteobacteria bacterium]|nr:hypothetical protein [Deltaproteobacteria bacterium]